MKLRAEEATLLKVTLLHEASNFIKNRSQRRCFSVKFAKFLKTPILKKISE